MYIDELNDENIQYHFELQIECFYLKQCFNHWFQSWNYNTTLSHQTQWALPSPIDIFVSKSIKLKLLNANAWVSVLV